MFESAVYPVPAAPHTAVRDTLGSRLAIGLAAMARTTGGGPDASASYDVHAVAVLRLLGPLTGATVDEVLEAVQQRALRLGSAADDRLDGR